MTQKATEMLAFCRKEAPAASFSLAVRKKAKMTLPAHALNSRPTAASNSNLVLSSSCALLTFTEKFSPTSMISVNRSPPVVAYRIDIFVCACESEGGYHCRDKNANEDGRHLKLSTPILCRNLDVTFFQEFL